jgi:secondary thiamine-phosphate synthase enzyme
LIAHNTPVSNTSLSVPGVSRTCPLLPRPEGISLKRIFNKIAPREEQYLHDEAWHDGNGYSHVRAALLKASITVPVVDGRMTLGTWQQIVFVDFDNRPRKREIIIQIMGE